MLVINECYYYCYLPPCGQFLSQCHLEAPTICFSVNLEQVVCYLVLESIVNSQS